jgi:hypothetical protein
VTLVDAATALVHRLADARRQRDELAQRATDAAQAAHEARKAADFDQADQLDGEARTAKAEADRAAATAAALEAAQRDVQRDRQQAAWQAELDDTEQAYQAAIDEAHRQVAASRTALVDAVTALAAAHTAEQAAGHAARHREQLRALLNPPTADSTGLHRVQHLAYPTPATHLTGEHAIWGQLARLTAEEVGR